MHRIYANLVQLNLRKLENVPSPWYEDTKKELEKRGWVEPKKE